MQTMTRPSVDLVPEPSPRREPIVLTRPPDRPLYVHRARVTYARRLARRAVLRKAWRITFALLVSVLGAVVMYLTAMAGLIPLLQGEALPPASATAPEP